MHVVTHFAEALLYNPEGAASIPDGVTDIFGSPNPSGRTKAMGSTQYLKERSTRNISSG